MQRRAPSGQVLACLIEVKRNRRYCSRVEPTRPLYFPVKPEPMRMQAGLFRFGTDFGNGDADRLFFPRDATSTRYLDEKSRVLAAYPGRDAYSIQAEREEQAVTLARAWLSQTLLVEGHPDTSHLPRTALGRELVEDFAVVQRDQAGADRALWLHACFPSGWRPEHVIGKSFSDIHAKIPGFDAVARKASNLVEAMLTRGPYVRFVWTVSADDELDHHPEDGRRRAWSADTPRGFLRVERQTIVPLREACACIFLIRTYLYGFDELGAEHRRTLALALAQMPLEISSYKRLTGALPRALELLAK
jgi:dimethylamine monooxygenase subunit A